MRPLTASAPETPPAAAQHQHRAGGIPTPTVQPSALAELLSIWQAWSDQGTLTGQIDQARAAANTKHLAMLTRALRAMTVIKPLDALAANCQLAELLVTLQTPAIRAAREAGATWHQIATAIGTTPEQAGLRWLGPPKAHPTRAHPTRHP